MVERDEGRQSEVRESRVQPDTVDVSTVFADLEQKVDNPFSDFSKVVATYNLFLLSLKENSSFFNEERSAILSVVKKIVGRWLDTAEAQMELGDANEVKNTFDLFKISDHKNIHILRMLPKEKFIQISDRVQNIRDFFDKGEKEEQPQRKKEETEQPFDLEAWKVDEMQHPSQARKLGKLIAEAKEFDEDTHPDEIKRVHGELRGAIVAYNEDVRDLNHGSLQDFGINKKQALRFLDEEYFKPAQLRQEKLAQLVQQQEKKKADEKRRRLEDKNIELVKKCKRITNLDISTVTPDKLDSLIKAIKRFLDTDREGDEATVVGYYRGEIEEKVGELKRRKRELVVIEYFSKIEPFARMIEDFLDRGIDSVFDIRSLVGIKKRVEVDYELLTEKKLVSILPDDQPEIAQIKRDLFGANLVKGKYQLALEKIQARREVISKFEIDFEKAIHVLDDKYLVKLNSQGNAEVTAAVKELDRITEHQPASFRRFMGYYKRFRDGFNQNTTANTPKSLMYTSDSAKNRHELRLDVNTPVLINFRNQGEIEYIDPDGKQYKLDISEVVLRIEKYFEEPWELSDGSIFTYAKNGNSNGKIKDKHGKVVPSIQERIVQDFPHISEFPSVVKDTLFMFIVLAEIRKDALILDFARYQTSPIPEVQDFGDLRIIAPGAQVLYSAQSSAFYESGLHPHLLHFPTLESVGGVVPNGWEVEQLEVDLPHKFVGREVEMMKKDSFLIPKNCKDVPNIVTLTQVSHVFRTLVSQVEIGEVVLKPHLKILPSYYDIIRGEFDGKKLKDSLTLDEYNTLLEAVEGFYKFVGEDFRKLSNIEQLDTHIGELVASIKKFKGIFGVIDIKTDELFTPFVQLLMLTYLKKMFNAFSELIEDEVAHSGGRLRYLLHLGELEERKKSALYRFWGIVKPLLEQSKTLPGHLLKPANGISTKALKASFPLIEGAAFREARSLYDDYKPGIWESINYKIVSKKGVITKKDRGSQNMKFSPWGVYFDTWIGPGKFEHMYKRQRNHHFYSEFTNWTRDKNIVADDGKK